MTADDYAFVRNFLRDRVAIVLAPEREYLIESRLIRLAHDLQIANPAELVSQLRNSKNRELPSRVIDAMVTTETSFFRDRHVFESLRTRVIPQLVRDRGDSRELNIWCAACATGQEPYSVAMLLREHFAELARWRVRILATDVSQSALSRAREAEYTATEARRGLSPALLARYFHAHGEGWQLDSRIRDMVEFRELNLARPFDLPQFDLVLLRNVLIYFDVHTKQQILQRVAQVMNPGACLLLGAAENALGLEDSFQRAEELKGAFYHRC
jgi:chemotaxis protein methyltransferase CheR